MEKGIKKKKGFILSRRPDEREKTFGMIQEEEADPKSHNAPATGGQEGTVNWGRGRCANGR